MAGLPMNVQVITAGILSAAVGPVARFIGRYGSPAGSRAMLGMTVATVMLAGCAHRGGCAAIASHGSATPAALECAAASGDKFAQLELGIRYESGEGVSRDLRRAERLYTQAARDEPRSRYVYSAPVGNERYGRLIPVSDGTAAPGLAEARERSRRLREARRRR